MNSTGKKKMSEYDKAAEIIAMKSSLNVTPDGPTTRSSSYPIPEPLKIALGNKPVEPGDLNDSVAQYTKILPKLRKFNDVQPNHYWFLMKLLIYLDHYQSIIDMSQFTRYNQKLQRSKYCKKSVIIYVPGLSENRPSIKTRDVILIRPVNGEKRTAGIVNFIGETYVVTRISDSSFWKNHDKDSRYNIFFLFSDYCLNCMHYAVDRAVKFNLLPVLFPAGRPTNKIQQRMTIRWVSNNIRNNPEQQQAVVQILNRSSYPAPYILFGPPGTGKTSTLVEAIIQIRKMFPANRILVCAPSNAAADEIAMRLLTAGAELHEMHRMYSVARESKEIPDVLKPCSNFAGDTPIYVSREILLTKKVVVTTLMSCHRLISYRLYENHFSYVFVDEAGQATEPETLIPMTLMSSKLDSHKGRLHGQLVIAGDPQQLGPIVQSQLATNLLGRSMLERLMDWELYRKNSRNKFNPSYVTKLVRNYRCHPSILQVPNVLFYDGELKACGGSHTKRAETWRTLPAKGFPMIFHAINGQEERQSDSPSVFNSVEVKTVISYVKELLFSTLGGQDVNQQDIGIVTPYKLQKQKIQEKLKKRGWNDIAVGTVETFQGQEKDVIIISTVRSVVYQHNHRVHIGFLSHPKRFNVAVTRAKALLIVIGDPVVLQVDKCWRSFITWCYNNGACAGNKFLLRKSRLSATQLRELRAQKHVPVHNSESDVTTEIDEKPPVEVKKFELPNIDINRRRRMPVKEIRDSSDSDESTDADDNEVSNTEKDSQDAETLDEDLTYYDADADEYDMNDYFLSGDDEPELNNSTILQQDGQRPSSSDTSESGSTPSYPSHNTLPISLDRVNKLTKLMGRAIITNDNASC